jgi:hypothetical protein
MPTSNPVSLRDASRPKALTLHLEIEDPEVLAELERRADAGERTAYAQTALRIGVLALRSAGGQVDAAAVREAGTKLLGDLRELLSAKAQEMSTNVSTALQRYLDPRTGALPQRIDALVRKDGELERILRGHLGPEGSVLAQSLAGSLGEQSPIFRMLSPDDASGLRAQLAATLREALDAQRAAVVREFSLDDQASALSRLVAKVQGLQGELQSDVRAQVESVVGEFSLDKEDSALSRLVAKVEAAQRAIADQFSTDNDGSALSRMTKVLDATSAQITQNLTLDDERSALSRLRRELAGTLADLGKRNAEFQAEVKATLAAMQARKQAEERGTVHGEVFEEQLGSWLAAEAQRSGDVHEPTGATQGTIPRCKVGDHVVALSRESAAAGARIVWEAKQDQGYTLPKALEELDEARRNRASQLGVFVFSRRIAPAGLADFQRHGPDFVVVWDPEDRASDVVLRAAYSAARALAVRESAGEKAHDVAAAIEKAVRSIEKKVEHLDAIKKWAVTIENNGQNIRESARKLHEELDEQVKAIDAQVTALRRGDGP